MLPNSYVSFRCSIWSTVHVSQCLLQLTDKRLGTSRAKLCLNGVILMDDVLVPALWLSCFSS